MVRNGQALLFWPKLDPVAGGCTAVQSLEKVLRKGSKKIKLDRNDVPLCSLYPTYSPVQTGEYLWVLDEGRVVWLCSPQQETPVKTGVGTKTNCLREIFQTYDRTLEGAARLHNRPPL
jgi:hypothetical protein